MYVLKRKKQKKKNILYSLFNFQKSLHYFKGIIWICEGELKLKPDLKAVDSTRLLIVVHI